MNSLYMPFSNIMICFVFRVKSFMVKVVYNYATFVGFLCEIYLKMNRKSRL